MKNLHFGIIAIVLFVLWLFFRKKSPSVDDYEPENFTYNGQKATISKGKAKTISTQIKEEFAKWNSNEDYIVSLFEYLNEADYILIYEQFGTMKKDPITGASSLLIGSSYNLTEWLIDVLDDEIVQMQDWFPTIF